jgi:hypothetical protein
MDPARNRSGDFKPIGRSVIALSYASVSATLIEVLFRMTADAISGLRTIARGVPTHSMTLSVIVIVAKSNRLGSISTSSSLSNRHSIKKLTLIVL